jgi:hypothetical protein
MCDEQRDPCDWGRVLAYIAMMFQNLNDVWCSTQQLNELCVIVCLWEKKTAELVDTVMIQSI